MSDPGTATNVAAGEGEATAGPARPARSPRSWGPWVVGALLVLAAVLLAAGLLGARALERSAASGVIPLDSAGPSLPVVTGPAVHTQGWSTVGDPRTRLAWTAVTIVNPGQEDVTIGGPTVAGTSHGLRAVLSGLVPAGDGLTIDDSLPRQLDGPGLATLVVPPGREALVVIGFTPACDGTDAEFDPSVTLPVSSASAGSGRFTIEGTDSGWARTGVSAACAPAP